MTYFTDEQRQRISEAVDRLVADESLRRDHKKIESFADRQSRMMLWLLHVRHEVLREGILRGGPAPTLAEMLAITAELVACYERYPIQEDEQ